MEGSGMQSIARLREPLNADVYKGHKLFFDATRDVLNFSDTVIAELNSKGIQPASMSQFDKVLLAWFFRQTTLSEQAWLLLSGGQEVGAAILVRSISEIRIKLQYISSKGPREFESLSDEFLQWGNAWALKHAGIALRICERAGDSDCAEAMQRKIDELDSCLGNKPRPADWWPGRSVYSIAKDAGIERFYDSVFRQYSAAVHSHPLEMLRDHSEPSGMRWTLYYPPKNVPGLLYAVYDCYLGLLDTVACQFWGHPFKRFDGFVARQSELERELDQIYS